jgi:lipopolysaccharide assembly protein A
VRLIYLLIIIVFALATLIFAVQNLAVVTVSFLTMNLAAPLALLVLVIYVLGAVTGSSLLALLRPVLHRLPGLSASMRSCEASAAS